jgi:hypothetical protein
MRDVITTAEGLGDELIVLHALETDGSDRRRWL